MNNILLTLLALAPFILLLVLIVVKKIPAIKSMPFVWAVTVAITIGIWKVSFRHLSASFLKAIFTTTEIMLIIFGAVLLIEVLRQKKQVATIHNLLSSISPDARVQAIIIAWFFGALIEGISGFGTPAALAAPILVSLGFSPALSVVLSLIGNASPDSFGAAGTPILLGLSPLNLSSAEIMKITNTTALFHSIAAFAALVIITYIVISGLGQKKRFLSLIKTLPFIFFSWLAFVIPYCLAARFIGPELPSIAGGLIGLIVVSIAAHYKFLTPKEEIGFKNHAKKMPNFKEIAKSILPYILIIIFLGVTRIVPWVNTKLSLISVSFTNIFGTEASYSFLPFYTPSFYFILAVLVCLVLYKSTKKDISVSLKNSFNTVKFPFIALLFTIAFVQLLMISSYNASSLPGIPELLAQSISSVSKNAYILISPFIGGLGGFISGSNTASNLLFGLIQSETAKAIGLSIILVLSLQVAGGAAGNMISIHNVIAANSVVGLKNSEGKIIRKLIFASLIYMLIVGLMGFVLAKLVLF
ncbi:MAG: L-lactate permease [Candidatus Nanoarchaeia archaeon]|nr:L-lactate permease [Candidatus Nanoarchaeia archaeon]